MTRAEVRLQSPKRADCGSQGGLIEEADSEKSPG
jgi:hypothetical protein